jgi:hypothetical protein
MFHYFKIPYLHVHFLQNLPTMNIEPYFLSHVVLRFSPVISPRLDPNATYREYILIALHHNTELESPFSSDDVNDISEIVIEKNEEDKNCVEGGFHHWETREDWIPQMPFWIVIDNQVWLLTCIESYCIALMCYNRYSSPVTRMKH